MSVPLSYELIVRACKNEPQAAAWADKFAAIVSETASPHEYFNIFIPKKSDVCNLIVDSLKNIIENEPSTLQKCNALLILHKCILTAHRNFLYTVNEKLMDTLLEFAQYKASDKSIDRARDLFGSKAAQKYAIEFHQNLLRNMKEWADLYSFLDGKISKFATSLSTLEDMKVTFPPPKTSLSTYATQPPPSKKQPMEEIKKKPGPVSKQVPSSIPTPQQKNAAKSDTNFISDGYQLILTINSTMEVWVEDKEIIGPMKEQIKVLQGKIQSKLSAEPEGDLEDLFNLNDIFNRLPGIMDKACKKDKNAQNEIIKIANEIERKMNSVSKPIPQPEPEKQVKIEESKKPLNDNEEFDLDGQSSSIFPKHEEKKSQPVIFPKPEEKKISANNKIPLDSIFPKINEIKPKPNIPPPIAPQMDIKKEEKKISKNKDPFDDANIMPSTIPVPENSINTKVYNSNSSSKKPKNPFASPPPETINLHPAPPTKIEPAQEIIQPVKNKLDRNFADFPEPVAKPKNDPNEFFSNIPPPNKQVFSPYENAFMTNVHFPANDVFQFGEEFNEKPEQKFDANISHEHESELENSGSKGNDNPFGDSKVPIEINNNAKQDIFSKNQFEEEIQKPEPNIIEKSHKKSEDQPELKPEAYEMPKFNDFIPQEPPNNFEQTSEKISPPIQKVLPPPPMPKNAIISAKTNPKIAELRRKIAEISERNKKAKARNAELIDENEQFINNYEKIESLAKEAEEKNQNEKEKIQSEIKGISNKINELGENSKIHEEIEAENKKVVNMNLAMQKEIENMKNTLEKLNIQKQKSHLQKDSIMVNIEKIASEIKEKEKSYQSQISEYQKNQEIYKKHENKPEIQYYTQNPIKKYEPDKIKENSLNLIQKPSQAIYSHVLEEMSISDPEPAPEPKPVQNLQKIPEKSVPLQPVLTYILPPTPSAGTSVSGFFTNRPNSTPSLVVDPIELAKSQLEMRYKNCITNPKSVWYEDHILQIGIMRQIDKRLKTAKLKLFLGNKQIDSNLHFTRFSLGAFDDKSLKINIENTPSDIMPKSQAQCGILIQVTKFFSTYNYLNIEYEGNNGFRNSINLKIPVNILMFCEKSQYTLEEMQAKIMGIKDMKISGTFELDTSRLKSMTQIKQILTNDNLICLADQGPGMLFGVTKFPNESNKLIEAIIHVTINKNVKQCGLIVYGTNTSFRDTITKNMLDVMAAPKQ